jgi:hypothetical protein
MNFFKQGAAIRATTIRNQPDFENKIKLFGCYRISSYAPVESGSFMNVVDNPTAIAMGTATDFQPCPETVTIPKTHFEFCSYDGLESRCGNSELLTGTAFAL